MTNCLVFGNKAEGGLGSSIWGAMAPSGDAIGAGIYWDGGELNLRSVKFTQNLVTGGLAPYNSMFFQAGGEGWGGAVYASNATLRMVDSTAMDNVASGGGSVGYGSGGLGSGNGLGGAFFLDLNTIAEIDQCTFTNNTARGGNGSRHQAAGGARGGALFSAGELRVHDSSLTANVCQGGSAADHNGVATGGAICSVNRLSVLGCTLYLNQALAGNFAMFANVVGEGGALWASGSLLITNSTFTANKAQGGTGQGSSWPTTGGPAAGGAIVMRGVTAFLANATLAANTAQAGEGTMGYADGNSEGGGFYVDTNSVVTVRNSIVANSTSGGDTWGAFTDGGFNIVSDASAVLSGPGSIENVDPLLGALSANGGPTLTMPLLIGSPGRDAVISEFPEFDQRGITRPQGLAADIGAFEADFLASAPRIVHQPESQTVRAGTNVMFSVTASGLAPLTYQWRKNGSPIVGETSATYSITNVQAMHFGAYSVVVSNLAGAVISEDATLTVDSMPLILSEPQSVEIGPEESVAFMVSADGPELSYQWFHDEVAIPGATASVLSIPAAVAGSQGRYFVIVSNFAGSTASAVATLIFNSSALQIEQHPANQSVEPGYPASFSVVASGVPPFYYQWFHNIAPILGATNSSFQIPAAQASHEGLYSVLVTNGYRQVASLFAELVVTSGATQPVLTIVRYEHYVAITFQAQAGRQYRLLSSTNLSGWSVLDTTQVATAGPVQFIKLIETTNSLFYRVVTP